MFPQHLIERALALTSINKEKMYEETNYGAEFSIEKFCYYLLSPEFVEKYHNIVTGGTKKEEGKDYICHAIGEAITSYQIGFEEPIISLLSKIGDQ